MWMPAIASPACEASAPQVAGQAGRGEQETLGPGDGHHGTVIGGGIDPLLDGGGGVGLGQESH